MRFYIALFLTFFMITASFGAEKNRVPRFVSLRPNEVNARVGPGPHYPIEWVYLKAGLPVEVIAEFDTWRKIRDCEGAEGWVHQSMVCSKRHAIVQGDDILIYKTEDKKSPPLARLQRGVIVNLLKCRDDWCQVRISGFKGWIQRHLLWGVYSQETVE